MNLTAALSATSSGFRKQLICIGIVVAAVLSLPVVAVAAAVSSAGAPSGGSQSNLSTGTLYTGGLYAGDTYAYGNCTYWAYLRRAQLGEPIPANWGNANTWAVRAQAAGYVVDHTPAVGAIMQTTAGQFGHVAVVENVATNASWTISEMNVQGWDEVDTRTLGANDAPGYEFIH